MNLTLTELESLSKEHFMEYPEFIGLCDDYEEIDKDEIIECLNMSLSLPTIMIYERKDGIKIEIFHMSYYVFASGMKGEMPLYDMPSFFKENFPKYDITSKYAEKNGETISVDGIVKDYMSKAIVNKEMAEYLDFAEQNKLSYKEIFGLTDEEAKEMGI